VTGVNNAEPENAGPENEGPDQFELKCRFQVCQGDLQQTEINMMAITATCKN